MSGLMVYEWKAESRITLDPQAVGREIEALQTKYPEGITPETVVTHARDKRSPMHEFFEWDDSLAGAKYRLDQARYLIRHIVITEIEEAPKVASKPIRAFVSVQRTLPNGKEKSGYMGVREALSDNDIRAQLLRRALGELKAWQVRYNEMAELAKVFNAIESTQSELGIDEAASEG